MYEQIFITTSWSSCPCGGRGYRAVNAAAGPRLYRTSIHGFGVEQVGTTAQGIETVDLQTDGQVVYWVAASGSKVWIHRIDGGKPSGGRDYRQHEC